VLGIEKKSRDTGGLKPATGERQFVATGWGGGGGGWGRGDGGLRATPEELAKKGHGVGCLGGGPSGNPNASKPFENLRPRGMENH